MKKTKKDLVELVYSKLVQDNHKATRMSIQATIDAFLESVKDTLKTGSGIELRGFGVFELRYRKPKLHARNPKTGQTISVEGHTVVAFRSGNELSEDIWSLDTSNLTDSKNGENLNSNTNSDS